jgi:hypothetical protein
VGQALVGTSRDSWPERQVTEYSTPRSAQRTPSYPPATRRE